MTNQKLPATNILVVDDEEIAQIAVGTMLERWNFHADIACTGREALEMVSKQNYNLIFMDLGISDMNGFQIIREIRNKGIHIPIVILTGYSQDSVKKHAADLGVIDYIVKPLTLEHCKRIIEKYICK